MKLPTNKRFKNLTGLINGPLVVVEYVGRNEHYRPLWKCYCNLCKQFSVLRGDSLLNHEYQSCGCIVVGGRTHNHTYHPLYSTWKGMMERCYNPNKDNYPSYGGRGIKVCDDWKNIENFIRDVGERPEGHTLDRINVNWHYCKENCRWADKNVQNLNTQKRMESYYASA